MKARHIRQIMCMVLSILVICTLLPTAASAGSNSNGTLPEIASQGDGTTDANANGPLSAAPYALATGHQISVKIYKVVLDSSKPLGYQTPVLVNTIVVTCTDGTTHSGYNHFVPLKNFHPNKVGLSTADWVGWQFNGYYSGGRGSSTFTQYTSSTVDATANVTGSEPYPCSKNMYLIYSEAAPQYTYTVHYDGNGGTPSKDSETSGTTTASTWTCNLSASAARDGYVFRGWSTTSGEDNVGNKVASVTLNPNRQTATVYAIWEKDTTTIANDYVMKVFKGIEDSQIPANFYMTYTITSGQNSGIRYASGTLSEYTSAVVDGNSARKYQVPSFQLPSDVTSYYINVTEHSADVDGYTHAASWSSSQYTNGQTNYEQVNYLYNTYDQQIQPSPEITLLKSVTPETVTQGDSVTYTIAVSNTGNVPLTNVVVTDSLPEGLSDPTDHTEPSDVLHSASKGNLQWTISALAVGESRSMTVTATVTADKTISANTATATADQLNGGTVTATSSPVEVTPETKWITVSWVDGFGSLIKTTPIQEGADYADEYPSAPTHPGYTFVGWSDPVTDADGNITITAQWTKDTPLAPETDWDKLTVEKTVTAAGFVKPGETVTYTISVTNNTGTALTDITVSEKLDENLTFVSADPAGQYNAEHGVWTIPSLANGKTATLTVKAAVNSGAADKTVIKNTATITDAAAGDDGKLPDDKKPTGSADVTVDNPVTPPIPVQPDWDKLTIEKSADSTDPVKPGDTVTYTINVTNRTGKDLTNITVLEKLDANLTFVSADPAGQYNTENGVWTLPSLANGKTATLTVKATVNSGVADGTVIKNTAAIMDAAADAGNLPDGNTIGDSADVTVTNPQIEPEPTDPSTPNDPADPSDPADPTTPNDPAQPADPSTPNEPPKAAEPADSPKTGDSSDRMLLWIALLCVSGSAAVGILYGRKRRFSAK